MPVAVSENPLVQIGNTPLIRISSSSAENGAAIWGKLEAANPGGSVKDRIALAMIEKAEADGCLQPGATIVEPTSGNTGIGLSLVAAVKGYRLILTMPDSMSIERRRLLGAYGAELVLTPGSKGMRGAIDKAEEIARQKKCFMPQQFNNPANPLVHRQTTGPEIIRALDGGLDAFVAGVGTGGTITGVGHALRDHGLKPLIVAVEPADSPVLSGGAPGPHKIQGIGAGFIPEILDQQIYSEVIQVKNEDAIATARKMARETGLFTGISSGANVFAATQIARRLGPGKTVVTVLCDTGERYLSTGIFD
ncbi:cysteine synthase A [Geothermobacter hydrogeniphilus]|uniref:Cysteine synthase n=1 Tax=Geothermobacter hydrogeniphilus TaxID=1969733 RepID=A0A1X0Y3W4_9BACT|nr:cysteine synthase A [Geothermobacter hydrogeniphilus]ORJ59788.1 cysteine synthase A [Geothermobacter hydrogeniphilus]